MNRRLATLALWGLLAVACDCHGEEPAESAPPGLAPREAPADLQGVACVDEAAWTALVEATGSSAALFPTDLNTLGRLWLGAPPLIGTTRLCGLWLEDGWLWAAQSTSGADAPVWWGAASVVAPSEPSEDRAEEAISLEVPEGAADYLVRQVLNEDAPASSGLWMRVPEGVLPRARGMLSTSLARRVTTARAALAEERARHDGPPTYGDPAVLLDAVASTAERFLAYLPDLGSARVTASAEGGALQLRLQADVRSGSPLARVMDQSQPSALSVMATLPAGTALAIHGAGEGAFSIPAVLSQLAASAEGAVPAEVDGFRGLSHDGPWTLALGSTESGSAPAGWARYASPLTSEQLEGALGATYTRLLAEGVLGCGSLNARWLRRREALPCVLRTLALEEGLIRVGTTPSSAPLNDHPDVARLFGGERVLGALYLDPSRLPALATASAWQSSSTAEASRPPGRTPEPTPLLMILRGDEGTLVLDVAATPGAPSPLLALVTQFALW